MVTVPSTIRDTEGLDGVSITQPGNTYATTIESALNTSTDLAQAGAVFNDAVRLSEGGLWSGSTTLEAASADNQQPYEPMYVQDINAVQADVNAMLASPNTITVGSQAISDPALTGELSEIQGQLATLAHEAPLSVGSGVRLPQRRKAPSPSLNNRFWRGKWRCNPCIGAQCHGLSGRHWVYQCRLPTTTNR